MKPFLKKSISILFLFFIGILSFVLLIHLTVKYIAVFTIPEKDKYVIFGHSHPECAFNDDLIINFKNLSKSGEGYFYTYQKVKEVLSGNNNINAIFVEYTNNSIGKHMDEWIWGYEKMTFFLPQHAPFMEKQDLFLLGKKNHQDFLTIISKSTRNNLTRLLSFDFAIRQEYGGYNKLERNKIAELIKERNDNSIDTLKNQEISISNLDYLDKIIEYCNVNNVKVYLIRSPQHNYSPRGNEQELLSIKNEKFKSLEFLDFDKFPLDDNEFGDFGHLNHKGAEVFSSWFNDLIKNGLMSRRNKAAFINTEIKKVTTKCINHRSISSYAKVNSL